MAANYNTLDDFLKRMDKGNAEVLMKAFVNGLEKSNTLEDAVDVADSYASINDKALHDLILNQVQYNLNLAPFGKIISLEALSNDCYLQRRVEEDSKTKPGSH